MRLRIFDCNELRSLIEGICATARLSYYIVLSIYFIMVLEISSFTSGKSYTSIVKPEKKIFIWIVQGLYCLDCCVLSAEIIKVKIQIDITEIDIYSIGPTGIIIRIPMFKLEINNFKFIFECYRTALVGSCNCIFCIKNTWNWNISNYIFKLLGVIPRC